ncbi:DUF4465 domain-containing protein [Stieleria sp. JC731]|uniref:DUF4465 domain-containing protein n=1 Tax=Pirellulaceae TaxID=2691357 RepID=UPI001E5BA10D|nr:DUF4465 domain-containing protein [Stieleria sp. JC731]MCC9599798.1 DUF4465 domain-containing protein [Stieleria sp. JC731]
MKRFIVPAMTIAICLLQAASGSAETVVDFEDLNSYDATLPEVFGMQMLGGGDVYNGYGQDAPTGAFTSKGVSFATQQYGPGFSYSRYSNTTDPGFTNQFAALPGGGSDGAGGAVVGQNYAMVNTGTATTPTGQSLSSASLYFDDLVDLASIDIANATYTALYFRDGIDGFSTGLEFSPGDFLSLTMTGFDASGVKTGSETIDLARFDGAVFDTDDYLEGWQTVDLSGFGQSKSLAFSLESSDFDTTFGLNVPAYAAIDNLRFITAIPEPSSFACLSVALVGLALRRRRTA